MQWPRVKTIPPMEVGKDTHIGYDENICRLEGQRIVYIYHTLLNKLEKSEIINVPNEHIFQCIVG